MTSRCRLTFILALQCAVGAQIASANIIDGTDERGSILAVGPSLGLSAEEIARIRKVSGHVGCFEPRPEVGSGALFLANDLILTAGHIFFDASGKKAGKCFFRPQTPGSGWLPLLTDFANARFGAVSPKPGSNNDWAVVRLPKPIGGVAPFPLPQVAPKAGDALIVVTAQPAGFEKLDPNVPVAQGCKIRRVAVSTEATSFYRTDCDATGASSGGMHLTRIGGALAFRGITITTGPWQDEKLRGAPYDEQGGSVTTALGTDAAILAAARALSSR